MTTPTKLGAIVLAGGRGSRVGGALKPLFEVGGTSLLRAAVDAAVAARAYPIMVASPVLDESLPVTWVRECPEFGGPVAAIITALDLWPTDRFPDWTLLLAADLPQAGAAVRWLREESALTSSDDGACLIDDDGRLQWLIGVYRTVAIRNAATLLPDRGQGSSVRDLLRDLTIRSVASPKHLTQDIDTWEDLDQARHYARFPTTAPGSKEQ